MKPAGMRKLWRFFPALAFVLVQAQECVHAGAGAALQFDGINGFVQVPNNQNLNPFPFTVTAWIRTTNISSVAQGIVSKYADSSFNGWSLVLQNGRLRGFYYSGSFNFPIDATAPTLAADGFWHHVAMTVDATGGKLYVDGIQVGSGTWPGTPGAPTGTQPLQIGRYYTNSARFAGTIDEVTLWNRSLGSPELNYLKHRQMNGNEDGLVALWHLDESNGSTASDSTGHGYTGTLVSNPAWVPSSAPLVFNQVAVNALKFDGINGYVQVAHTNDLNSYPFTATAWFRTTNTANVVQGIVSKYADASYNGWTLVVQNGRLRGFYYRAGALSDVAIDATSTASVADGSWHHAALTVDASGGKLFLDGTVVGQSAWTGAAGGMTSTEPLQIGRYYNYAQRFQGAIDEVTVWNRALATGEVQAMKNLPLDGNEPGLAAYWRLNEGSGTNTADATGLGHTGILTNNPAWVGSTAFLGDGTSAIHTTLGSVQWTRQFAVKTIPAERGFTATAPVWVRRLDDFGAPGGATGVSITLSNALQGTVLAGPVSLVNNTTQFNISLPSFLAAAPQVTAGGVVQSPLLDVEPQAGTQLDSVNDFFQLGITEFDSVNSGPTSTQDAITLSPMPLLHFDGNLLFGPLVTSFTSIANSPARGAAVGGGISTTLAVNNNSGYVIGSPSHTYGNGTPISVVLLSSGDAVSSNTVTLNAPATDIGTIQNISFSRSSETLTPTGAVAYADVLMPLGFSIGIGQGNHETINFLPLGYVVLDANLNPTNTAFVFKLNNSLLGVEETLPYWFASSNISWQVTSGQIILNLNASGAFVRQNEDEILQGQTNLVDATTTNRVSNDGYFRNASPGGSQLIVTADTNGVAQINVQLALNPPELRPHFPYSGRNAGSQIPTGNGLLILSNSLVSAGSYLNVTSAVPVAYGRDCTYIDCSAAQAGPAALHFTPAGQKLNFTADGGLLAYGSVPTANLQWGYTPSGYYAQQAGPVGGGAFCMAGSFLNANQTTLDDSQRAAVILFSGFGDASHPAYFERPGLASYNDGFANYPGLNFRSPVQGLSYLAQTSVGPYPLNPVSKYYVRFGGVNGIHQASSFPSTLSLYGYSFTFTDYGLSYLDGQNWQSVTAGAISFPPQPAGFTQGFDRMKLTCRGDLSSANLPSGGGTKHLAYWNVDFTPQSIDFHPTNDDTCGTSSRFLVLGVETKLPFIPQALHAALGFKANGNLVCPQDNVSNVDSRFDVPAQLSLQGPGTTMFTLSTANEGYFNNWDTPGAPALGNGFYNLEGKISVPFFSDIKVHLHVTPVNATTSQIDIMGGWPAADSTAADLGWTENGSNYFNEVKFDPHSDGWPPGLAIKDYIDSSSPQFRPRAERDWIEVAMFDYPLEYNNVLHSFDGFQDAKVVLPVIDVNSRLKELAPGKVDFDFAQDLSLQLPQLKVLDFVNDALNGNIGPLLSLSNAIRSALNQTFDATGLNELSQTLREDAQSFFNPVLDSALDLSANPAMNNLYNAIAALPQTNQAAFLGGVYQLVTVSTTPLQPAIQSINGAAGQANSVVGKLDQTLTDVQNTVGLFNRILEKDSSGNRHVVRTIIEKLVNDQGPALGFVASLGDDVVNPLLADLDGTLGEIQTDLQEVNNQLAQVHAQLTATSGGFNQALSSALQDTSGMNQFIQTAGANLTNYLASVVTPAGDYFTANPAVAQAAIRKQFETAFLSSTLPGNYQTTFRQFLSDKDFALNQLMSTLFDEINRTIRNSLSSAISGAQDGVFQNMKGGGLLSGSLLAAQIRGAPTFDGDSLRAIHLDAAVQMNLPDAMNFTAYMDIMELDSQSVPLDCIPAGAPAAEITLGAKDVPLEWAGLSPSPGSKLDLDLEARWTLQSGAVLGIGGAFNIHGKVDFQGCTVTDIGATLAIGQIENYFAAKAAGSVLILGIPVDVQAGVFAGHACTLAPLTFIDPEASLVLNDPMGFSGVYVEYGGGLSLSEILFRTSSCLLDVEANTTTAIYYEGGPRFGTIGGRQKMGVDVSLLCVVSGHVDWSVFMQLMYGQLTLGASADVCGSIGDCPFCVSGCKGITVTGTLTTGGIDYSIDY
jgi:Concanavalin A-like lectin/glucanases superfamily